MNAWIPVLSRLALMFVSSILLAGCQRNPAPTPPEKQDAVLLVDAFKDEPRAQIRIGDGKLEEWGSLPFTILKVYSGQKPIDAIPWHADGGDWTFFDCQTDSPRSANFMVGVRAKSREGKPIAWGEATFHGQKYYYYETLDGKFISAGLAR